jgi:hypothetical protein
MATAAPSPEKIGLYDPSFEKDSCGVTIILNIDGTKDHETVANGSSLQVVLRPGSMYLTEFVVP